MELQEAAEEPAAAPVVTADAGIATTRRAGRELTYYRSEEVVMLDGE